MTMLNEQRLKKINIFTTLLSQLVTIASGVIVPRLMLQAYGSEAYGISVSIAQFLAYISLVEGGIGGVGRGKLYGALAAQDTENISAVYNAIQAFFRGVAAVFIGYCLVLGFGYYDLASVTVFSREYIFCLVLVIGVTTLANYMFGLANLTLIVSDRKQYVNNLVLIGTTIGNTVAVAWMIQAGCDLIWAKIGSSLVFLIKPLAYWLYVRRHYRLIRRPAKREKLEQKWTGLGQHLAYFVHSNVDVVMLTVVAGAIPVAIYAVYNMVIQNIRKLVEAAVGGMEAVFGEKIASQQWEHLRVHYFYYKTISAGATVLLFGCTGILILPFVRLYTSGIEGANYIQPAFALIFLLAETVNCLCLPCASLPVAAGQLKQTRWGAYGEAVINVVLSAILIWWDPLAGVAIGTLVASLFRAVYYMIYAAKTFLHIPLWRFLGGHLLALGFLAGVVALGNVFVERLLIENYYQWIVCGAVTFLALCIPVLAVLALVRKWHKKTAGKLQP